MVVQQIACGEGLITKNGRGQLNLPEDGYALILRLK
jgi:hypothetical protein